ncbi:MAG: sigma-54-dependent Fis family transcriptional regulator [Ignavibacteriae bacterium]|nr:sigma-54-dependent Fis family transcriptional regulator [Ignavibacteriota bacterium]
MRPESILIVDDERLLRWAVREELTAAGFTVHEAQSAAEARAVFEQVEPDLVLLDQILEDEDGLAVLAFIRTTAPDIPVIMITAVDTSDVAVRAMKLGAYDYVTKPINFEELHLLIGRALEQTLVHRQYRAALQEQVREGGVFGIIGASDGMKRIISTVMKFAGATASTVLLTGESGTGKEVVARALHSLGDRKDKAFVTVNCASIPRTLMESELFGHERGAFTDARARHKGVFELAHGGTLFLDEIGDLPLELQAVLLRALEEKTFRRVGGEHDIGVDVRIIAATNQNLETLIEKGQFRQDLYYRLDVMHIELPPLRTRGTDILLLAHHFLQEFNTKFRKEYKGLSEETKKLFLSYSWPGNVRELRNVIERAAFLDDGEYIFSHSVQLGHLHSLETPVVHEATIASTAESLDELERNAIKRALGACDNNQSQAARLLQISRDTLRYRMKKHGIT